jgi:hypothetical protein
VEVTALLERIARRIADGASLDEIERGLIEPTQLSENQKAALWLFAWSLQPPRAQRAEASRLALLA